MLSEEALKLLEEYHQFPCVYAFKAIGQDSPEFKDAVQEAAQGVLGALYWGSELMAKPSSKGKYISITVETEVKDAAQVLEVYAALKKVEGLVVLV
jgi:putative lipoic acid-binding regulatory protein